MAQAKEMAKTGKRMGKKVMATDTAQDVVGVVVDGLEEVAVDKTRSGGWPQLGAIVAILGVIDATFAPRLLKRAWDRQDRQ